MKQFLKPCLAALLLLAATTATQAQLPQKFAIIAGGGASFPYVKAYEYDFYAKYGNRTGYNLLAEARYFFRNEDQVALGVGLQFDYINNNAHEDKLHAYFGRPEFILRLALDDDEKQALFVSIGAGLMHYEEKMNPILEAQNKYERTYGHHFHRNYFAVGAGVGFEFAITKGFGGMVRFDYSASGIFVNQRARLIDIYGDAYDDAEHKWLKSRMQFFNLSFALQFGM